MARPNIDAGRLGATNNVVVATTSTAVASSAFGAQTMTIRVAATGTCFIKISDGSPTATTTDTQIMPNYPEYFIVTPGQKVSAFSPTIQNVNVTEFTQ